MVAICPFNPLGTFKPEGPLIEEKVGLKKPGCYGNNENIPPKCPSSNHNGRPHFAAA